MISVWRTKPRLVYQQRGMALLGDAQEQLSSDIEILYHHQRLASVTKTYLIMWNAGRVMSNSDCSIDDPLRFEIAGDAQVLNARVVKASENIHISASHMSARPNAIAITFDELGPGEGAVVEVLHTSPARFGVLRGAISGMPGGPEDRGRVRHPFNPLPSQVPSSFRAIGNTAFVLTFGIGALLVILSAFAPYLAPVFGPHVAPVMSVIEGVSDVIYAAFAIMVLTQTRRRFPEDLAVSELVE